MLEFLVGSIIIIGLLILAAPQLLKFYAERAMRLEVENARAITPVNTDPLLIDLTTESPALIYFTADWCGPCRTTQTPIIDQLKSHLGGKIQVLKVDVEAEPDAATRWGVKILPRTVVLRPDLSIHAVNVGVASEQTLAQQIASARTSTDAPVMVTREEVTPESSGFKFKFSK